MHSEFLETSFGYELSQKILANFLSKKSVYELAKRLKKNGAKSVLDIGCATAFYRNDIPVPNFTGIDINSNFIKTASEKFPDDKFFVMDAARLKFKSNIFDAVISKGVLHHLSKTDFLKTLKESLRVLKSDGKIIILDAIQPTKSWNIIGRILRNMDQGHHILTADVYKSRLEKNFKIDEFKVYSSFPYEVCVYVISKSKNKRSTKK